MKGNQILNLEIGKMHFIIEWVWIIIRQYQKVISMKNKWQKE